MPDARFRFYGPLNDFLPRRHRKCDVAHAFGDRPAVKDAIEALGVPHPEVAYVFVDGAAVSFAHQLAGRERVAVYPFFAELDPGDATRASPPHPADPRFVLDVHLRRLATYVRLLGFDCLWWEGAEDPDLAAASREEGRILLTRDLGLLKRSVVVHGAFVRATQPQAQLHEVVVRFGLTSRARPFTRCMRCNSPIEDVPKEDVLQRLEERTRWHYDLFRACTGCDRIYWRGAHFDRLVRLVASVLPDFQPEPTG